MRRLVILFIVLVIALSGCTQKISERSLKEVEYALRAIRDAYDSRPEQYDGDVYTVEDAVKATTIEQRILEDWDFEIVGNPPEKFVANSSSVNVLGTGKKVWYDVEEKAYHGFGIDK